MENLLRCPFGNSFPCPTEVGELVNTLIHDDSAIDIETYRIGIAQRLNSIWKHARKQ